MVCQGRPSRNTILIEGLFSFPGGHSFSYLEMFIR